MLTCQHQFLPSLQNPNPGKVQPMCWFSTTFSLPKTQSLPEQPLRLRGGQLAGTRALQSGAHGGPRCHEDARCPLKPGLRLLPPDLSGGPTGLPCTPRRPTPAQPHNFQPLPPDLHCSGYTHWAWVDLLGGGLWATGTGARSRRRQLSPGYSHRMLPRPPAGSASPPPYLRQAAELPGSLSGLLWLILLSAAQYFIIHLSEMYISLLRALLE